MDSGRYGGEFMAVAGVIGLGCEVDGRPQESRPSPVRDELDPDDVGCQGDHRGEANPEKRVGLPRGCNTLVEMLVAQVYDASGDKREVDGLEQLTECEHPDRILKIEIRGRGCHGRNDCPNAVDLETRSPVVSLNQA